jgi:membrane protein DedA with SNARE-associated domain
LKKFASTLVAWGPPGLFLLTMLDSAGVPIPGVVDTLLVFLAAKSPALWAWFALIAIAGSMTGAMIMFFLARKGGEKLLDRYTAHGRGARFRRWYLKYGLITVFIPALSPIPMPLKIAKFCAGALGVSAWKFAGVMLTARTVRYFSLAYLGSSMGDETFSWIGSHKAMIGGGLAALALVLGAVAWWLNRDSSALTPSTNS